VGTVVERHSEEWRTDVEDCDTSVRPYPGDLALVVIRIFDLLSRILSLVYIGVEVDVWYIAIQDGSRRLDHSVGKLRRYSGRIAEHLSMYE
jgi:hypothetical protein